jgi:putative tryptophan/tyrosine transport system substrate-binding protein
MRLIWLVVVLAVSLLAASLDAESQQAGKVYRIGYLVVSPLQAWKTDPRYLALMQALRELGWVEGKNIAIEFQSAEGKFERLPAVASELAQRNVDLILVTYDNAARAAKQATTTIPIVMLDVGDPVGSGLVGSLARPGGNVTGLTSASPDLVQKRLELLKAIVPQASRVAVVSIPRTSRGLVNQWSEAQAAAHTLRLTLLPVEVRGPDDFEPAFTAMTQARTQAFIVLGDPSVRLNAKRFLDLAAKHRLPAMYNGSSLVQAGGLMSYAPNDLAGWRRAAIYVDKILKGANPAELPIEQPTKFELAINVKTAKALGLTVPQSLLGRADQVIE